MSLKSFFTGFFKQNETLPLRVYGEEKDSSNEDIRIFLANIDKVVIEDRLHKGEARYVEISPREIVNFKKCLLIDENVPKHYIRTIGSYKFILFVKEQEVASIEYLEHDSIRWRNVWKDDASLKDGYSLLTWLNKKGIVEPLKRYNDLLEKNLKRQRALEAWYRIAPNSLVRKVEDSSITIEATHAALSLDIANENERILVLFKLLGMNDAPWTQYGLEDSTVDSLLMTIDIERLIEAMESRILDNDEIEGMSRFLTGWGFRTRRESDVSKIPSRISEITNERKRIHTLKFQF